MGVNHGVTGRFAPSPSGQLHIGNLATSLLTWLDAKSSGGRLIFRMEDLDPDRSSLECATGIADALKVLGLDWDEGYPDEDYCQSRRGDKYDEVFELLLHRDMLYPCYCSRSERLAASASHPGEQHRDPSCRCRYLSAAQRRELERSGKRAAWKIKVPDAVIEFNDGLFGKRTENLADTGDFIIKRSDGVYAYQLAVSFDDADMGVTRVVRGRDLISSTARQIWLISELGGTVPQYIHAPLIVGTDGRKLSKRYGDTTAQQLLQRHTPEEIIGYLAGLVGISDGSPCTASELLSDFEWEKVRKDDIRI